MPLRLLIISLMILPGLAPLCGAAPSAAGVTTPTSSSCGMSCEVTCATCCCQVDSTPADRPTDAPFVPVPIIRLAEYLPAATPLLYVLIDSPEPSVLSHTARDRPVVAMSADPHAILCSWLT